MYWLQNTQLVKFDRIQLVLNVFRDEHFLMMKKVKKTPVEKIAHIKLVLGDFACLC